MSIVLAENGKLLVQWDYGAEPRWPLQEALPEAPKMLASSKSRFLIMVEPFNFWVEKVHDIFHLPMMRIALWEAMNTVRDNFMYITDLYPIVETARKNLRWCKAVDGLLTLENIRLWWLTPSGNRVWDSSLVVHRFYTPLYVSPQERMFASQLLDVNKEGAVPKQPLVLPDACLSRKKARAASWKASQGNVKGNDRSGKKRNSPAAKGGGKGSGGAPKPKGKSSKGKQKPKKCYNCGSYEHLQADCPHPKGFRKAKEANTKAN